MNSVGAVYSCLIHTHTHTHTHPSGCVFAASHISFIDGVIDAVNGAWNWRWPWRECVGVQGLGGWVFGVGGCGWLGVGGALCSLH